MKILKTGALCVLTCLCYVHADAQQPSFVNESDYNKPKIFTDLPTRVQLNQEMLANLLNHEVGKKVAFQLGQAFYFQGIIVSKSDATDNQVMTVVVKATNRQGVTLTFTRHTNAGGSYTYTGRMLSFKHGDAFEIVEEEGKLVLVKKDRQSLIED